MKVLVSGATGFIGNYVIKALLKKNIDIIATSTSIEKAQLTDWYNRVTFVEHDIAMKETSLMEKFHSPDILIHLAWRGLPNYTKLFHFEDELMIQYHFLKQLIEEGISNINITGTCFEYGMQEGCLNEETTISNPDNSYAIAKDTLRKFLNQLQNEFPFCLKWLRLFYMYGNGQSPSSILSQLQKALDAGETIFNMSPGDQMRDYLTVEQVADYIVEASLQTKIKGIINICSQQPIKIIDLVNRYLSEQNRTISLNLGFYNYPQYEPFAFWGDNSKLKKILLHESN